MLKLRSFTLVSFYLLYLFTCYNGSASSTQIMSNTQQDLIGDIVDICALVFCGKGKCINNGFLNFTCECDPGWKKLKLGSIEFPTCALPNCTIDLQCGNGQLPIPPPPNSADPCLLNLCGDGTCVKNGSDFKCQCNEGSANLFNNHKMICLPKCGIGGDCNGLDVGLFTPPTSPPPPPPTTNTTSAGSPGTGSGEMLNFSKKLCMLTIMILTIIYQN